MSTLLHPAATPELTTAHHLKQWVLSMLDVGRSGLHHQIESAVVISLCDPQDDQGDIFIWDPVHTCFVAPWSSHMKAENPF